MPLQPNLIERQLIRSGIIPGLLLDAGMSMFEYWAFMGAMKVGFFEAIAEKPRTVSEIASVTDCSEAGIGQLVRVFEPLGYIDENDNRYSLSSAARRSLPVDILSDIAPFFEMQMSVYTDIERAIRDAPEDGIVGWEKVQSGETGRSYQIMMRWLASQSVQEVVGKISIPDSATHMVDIGGSHGLYTVAFCRKHPGLKGTILDWPIGLEAAKQTLEENPDVADRIDLVECDFEKEDLPTGFDVAFLGNIIHGISETGNRELFAKLSKSMNETATVGILDQFAGVTGSKFARGIAALLGFNLFLFSGGRSYPFDDVASWLSEAGFPSTTSKNLRQPGFSLAISTR